MLRNFITALFVLAFVGCTPSYANAETMTTPKCQVVHKAALDILDDFRAGKTQFEVMANVNDRSSGYWKDSNAAKVYTQVIVVDLMKNVNKGFRNRDIIGVVDTACQKQIGKVF